MCACVCASRFRLSARVCPKSEFQNLVPHRLLLLLDEIPMVLEKAHLSNLVIIQKNQGIRNVRGKC